MEAMTQAQPQRPAETDLRMLGYLADRIEQISAEMVRFANIVSERMLDTKEVCSRLGIGRSTFYKWQRDCPWKLPNWGVSAIGNDAEYRCSISDFHEWYRIPDAERARQWDSMGPVARRKALGMAV